MTRPSLPSWIMIVSAGLTACTGLAPGTLPVSGGGPRARRGLRSKVLRRTRRAA
jgi:hypothetical protein